ncbi:MAG: hypothetical protein ACREDL_20620 [Bradyrhizobium sp.]
MGDNDRIPALLALASNANYLQDAQHIAAKKLLEFDGENYPSDGCAITLSVLLQQAGITIPDTYRALALQDLLTDGRDWKAISVGEQQGGDVGSTCGSEPGPGDHIYLVLKALNPDEMVVADNQSTQPHFRFASGNDGKTPTTRFLRAQG